MTNTESELRLRLAAAYRIFAMLGWVEMIYNHITVRLPGPDGQFLINPFGLHYSEVTASNLVKIDLQGRKLDDSPWPVNPAGFTVHSAIHDGMEDAHCVMHTHTTAGCAVAGAQAGLSMDNFYSAQLHDRVAYHDFEGITVHADEGPRLLRSIGKRPAVILRNHGLLSWGRTIEQAFVVLWTLQRACDVQLASSAGGAPHPIRPEVFARMIRDSGPGEKRTCDDVFAAMQRIVDAKDPSYRD